MHPDAERKLDEKLAKPAKKKPTLSAAKEKARKDLAAKRKQVKPKKKRTAAITLINHRSQDMWRHLEAQLKVSTASHVRSFIVASKDGQTSESWDDASVELVVDEDFNVVGGRILRRK